MPVSLRESRDRREDRAWIERNLRDYLDDLGPLSTGIFPVLDEIGLREPDQLQGWLNDPNATLLTILDEHRPVGFALILHRPPGARDIDYRMAEFFIARSARRRGLGRSAVRLILDRFAGRWEVIEYQRNPGAVAFWRRIVADYTKGDYRERVANGEVRQLFRSGPANEGR